MRSTIFLFPLSHAGMLGSDVSTVAATTATVGALCDAASCFFANHSMANPTYSFGLEES